MNYSRIPGEINDMPQLETMLEPLAYRIMAERLRQITEAVSNGEGGQVSLLVLFGSVARLTATAESDADVLALYASAPDWYAAYQQATPLVRRIRQIEEEMADQQPNWPISVISGTADASDLDADFLANVSADGVLLYRRPGTPLPTALAHSRSLADWVRDIERALSVERQTSNRQAG